MRDDLDELLDTIDLEYWMEREGVQYRVSHGSSGTQLNIKTCPVCGNNHYKVYLNADTGQGNCFAGDHPPGMNFSKYYFIRAHLGNVSGREVVEHIRNVAKEMGWRPPRKTSAAVVIKGDLKLPASLELPTEGRNLKYLDNRNIDKDIARYFHLRYSHTGWFDYKLEGRWMRQDYSHRIIIPIFDLEGQLVSFQGRDITGSAEQKYLFPPGFASTGKHLYNGHNAVGAKRVVMGEGVFDVAAIKIALDGDNDLRDVAPIGSFGKHLSHGSGDDQLGKFLKLRDAGLKEVTIMWDGEQKALDAAISTGLILKGVGLSVRIAILPANKDPNEVTPDVVKASYYKAIAVTKASMARLKLLNMEGRIFV